MGISTLLPVHPIFPILVILSAELIMTVFSIHFFSQVQTKVDKQVPRKSFLNDLRAGNSFHCLLRRFLMALLSSVLIVPFF